jgi:hypothetical protein
LNSNAVSRNGGLIVSARQSNAIRGALRTNAFRASSEGLAGRVAIVRPPLGTTTRAQALSTTSQPGVGAYREQRVVYAFPGTATFVPQIAARGLSGGAGFTADGIIDTGFDSWVASTCSQLAPEENPGQLTGFMAGIISVERGNPDVQDMRENDYKAFRAGGIAALRMDDGIAIIQSGITSVEPSGRLHPRFDCAALEGVQQEAEHAATPCPHRGRDWSVLERVGVEDEPEFAADRLLLGRCHFGQHAREYRGRYLPHHHQGPDAQFHGLYRARHRDRRERRHGRGTGGRLTRYL